MSTSAIKRYSVDDYLALEEASETKHEYYDGEIFDMAGGTARHSVIAGNWVRELGNALKDRGCLVFTSVMNIFTPTGLRTYPDVSVVCSKPEYETDKQRTLLNPLLIVEVLSESTEAYDRGKKFDDYQSIESLREYVLVSQDRAHVDRFSKRDSGEWVIVKSDDLVGSVELPALKCLIPMREVYAGVEFEQDKPAGQAS